LHRSARPSPSQLHTTEKANQVQDGLLRPTKHDDDSRLRDSFIRCEK